MKKKISKEEARQGFQVARAAVERGATVKDACDEAGINVNTFYYYRARDTETKPKRKYSKRKSSIPAYVDIPLKSTSSNVAIVVCKASQINEILEVLK